MYESAEAYAEDAKWTKWTVEVSGELAWILGSASDWDGLAAIGMGLAAMTRTPHNSLSRTLPRAPSAGRLVKGFGKGKVRAASAAASWATEYSILSLKSFSFFTCDMVEGRGGREAFYMAWCGVT